MLLVCLASRKISSDCTPRQAHSKSFLQAWDPYKEVLATATDLVFSKIKLLYLLCLREILPAESPSKTGTGHHALSWQQLSQPGLLLSLTHKIQQRLNRQATPSAATATPRRIETPIRHPVCWSN